MTVAAGPGLSLPAKMEDVELNVAQASSDRVLAEWWKQLELHNGASIFCLHRGRKALVVSECRDAVLQLV